MPIRYKCDKCGSTLNIKEELAGTPGKCPKCKTAFTVPQPVVAETATQRVADVADATVAKSPSKPAKPARSAKPARGKKKAPAATDDDFDPMAVLMGDEPAAGGGARKPAPSSPPLSDDEIPADLDFELEIGSDPDEEDEPAPKKSKKRRRVQFDSDDDFDAALPNSASGAANAMLSGGASAGAKDLLTRTMEEGRARASRVDDDEDDSPAGPTIQDYLREYGLQAAGILAGFVVVFYGLYHFASGMYGGGVPLPDLGRVYGVVTLDGKPLSGARVRFSPVDRKLSIDKNGKHKYRASSAVTDEEGYYDLYYTEDIRGAAVTRHRVSIEKMDKEGRLLTPLDYYDITAHEVDVEPSSNEFNFDLESDAAGAPAAGQ